MLSASDVGLERTVALYLEKLSPSSGERFINAIHTDNQHRMICIEQLNRYFRLLIAKVPIEQSRNALEALCVSHDFSAWFVNFKRFVAPLLLHYKLLGE